MNVRDKHGRTPLIYICTWLNEIGHQKAKKVFTRLLEVPGIDVLAVDNAGMTARDWCSNDAVKEMLREAEEERQKRKAEE